MTSTPRNIPKLANRRATSLQSGVSEMSRSPKESPPTIKKKLCRLVNGAVSADISEFRDSVSVNKNGKGLNSSSILKKVIARGSPRSSPKNTSPASSRRVQFRQHVTVFHLSDDGDVFCSECQNLNTDAENQRPVPRSTRIAYHEEDSMSLPQQYHGGRSQEKCDLKVVDDIVDASQVDYIFVEDPDRGTVLKFVIPLGHEYKPDDIVVKANVSGSRVRLVANKPVSYPDGSMRMEQLSKRFLLPTEVDPYMVTARLDIKGQLTVEAPTLTIARRKTIKSNSQALSDISNKAK